MKNSTLIIKKYKKIKELKNKVYQLFDKIEQNGGDIDKLDWIYLKDWIKTIKILKEEVKKLKNDKK